MPMKNCTPEKLSPREDTLLFLRLFARTYHTEKTVEEARDFSASLFMQKEQALC